jgi:hypothetical protein
MAYLFSESDPHRYAEAEARVAELKRRQLVGARRGEPGRGRHERALGWSVALAILVAIPVAIYVLTALQAGEGGPRASERFAGYYFVDGGEDALEAAERAGDRLGFLVRVPDEAPAGLRLAGVGVDPPVGGPALPVDSTAVLDYYSAGFVLSDATAGSYVGLRVRVVEHRPGASPEARGAEIGIDAGAWRLVRLELALGKPWPVTYVLAGPDRAYTIEVSGVEVPIGDLMPLFRSLAR